MYHKRYALLAAALACGPLASASAQITNGSVPSIMDSAGENYLFTGGYNGTLGAAVIGQYNGTVSLRIEGGSAFTTQTNPYIGNSTTSNNNSVVVTGAGSSFTNAQNAYTYVGYWGSHNSFSILDGATASLGRLVASYNIGSSHNTATISGNGSRLASSFPTLLGYMGKNASLVISDGGVFSASNRIYIGFRGSSANASQADYQAGGGGHSAIVTGSGSTMSTNGSAGYLYVGNAGNNNTLRIENGGTVTSVGAYIGTGGGYNDGIQTAWNNTATVTGNGSVWEIVPFSSTTNGTTTVTANDFYVGKAGYGNSLKILNGGKVINPKNLHISGDGMLVTWGNGTFTANMTTTDNSVLVSGAGSVLENGGNINIGTQLVSQITVSGNTTTKTYIDGEYSQGTLTIADSGLVMIGSAISDSSVLSVAENCSVQVNGGFLAWYGDLTLGGDSGALYDLIAAEKFSVLTEAGSWVTASASDFTISFAGDEETSLNLTGGLYGDLAGYTILTSAYVVPEPAAAALLCLGLAALYLRSRDRKGASK